MMRSVRFNVANQSIDALSDDKCSRLLDLALDAKAPAIIEYHQHFLRDHEDKLVNQGGSWTTGPNDVSEGELNLLRDKMRKKVTTAKVRVELSANKVTDTKLLEGPELQSTDNEVVTRRYLLTHLPHLFPADTKAENVDQLISNEDITGANGIRNKFISVQTQAKFVQGIVNLTPPAAAALPYLAAISPTRTRDIVIQDLIMLAQPMSVPRIAFTNPPTAGSFLNISNDQLIAIQNQANERKRAAIIETMLERINNLPDARAAVLDQLPPNANPTRVLQYLYSQSDTGVPRLNFAEFRAHLGGARTEAQGGIVLTNDESETFKKALIARRNLSLLRTNMTGLETIIDAHQNTPGFKSVLQESVFNGQLDGPCNEAKVAKTYPEAIRELKKLGIDNLSVADQKAINDRVKINKTMALGDPRAETDRIRKSYASHAENQLSRYSERVKHLLQKTEKAKLSLDPDKKELEQMEKTALDMRKQLGIYQSVIDGEWQHRGDAKNNDKKAEIKQCLDDIGTLERNIAELYESKPTNIQFFSTDDPITSKIIHTAITPDERKGAMALIDAYLGPNAVDAGALAAHLPAPAADRTIALTAGSKAPAFSWYEDKVTLGGAVTEKVVTIQETKGNTILATFKLANDNKDAFTNARSGGYFTNNPHLGKMIWAANNVNTFLARMEDKTQPIHILSGTPIDMVDAIVLYCKFEGVKYIAPTGYEDKIKDRHVDKFRKDLRVDEIRRGVPEKDYDRGKKEREDLEKDTSHTPGWWASR